MKKQNILFNLDDTLVYCNRYFNDIIGLFSDQLNRWFESYSKEEIKNKQLELDIEAISTHGLGSERFPDSFINTYKYFCERTGKKKKKRKWII